MVSTLLLSIIKLVLKIPSHQSRGFDSIIAVCHRTLATCGQTPHAITTPPEYLVTVDDCTSFERDPTTLVNKQFILEEDRDGGLLYEIVEVRFSKGGWVYQVQFEGCSDSINVQGQEMMEMLTRSSLVQV